MYSEQYWQERKEDEARWQDYLQTGDAVPHEKVVKWLDDVVAGEQTKIT